MTLRFESAIMVGQRCLLQYLVPWLENIELVDICNPVAERENEPEDNPPIENYSRQMKPISLQGGGWGSNQASQMVLNNLFYLTVKVLFQSQFFLDN